jgi:hypothetical protein
MEWRHGNRKRRGSREPDGVETWDRERKDSRESDEVETWYRERKEQEGARWSGDMETERGGAGGSLLELRHGNRERREQEGALRSG